MQNELSLESNKRDVGKRFRVLVEGPSKRNPEDSCGRASNNKMCVFPSMDAATGKSVCVPGDYVDVEVLSCTSATLICKMI